jgi:hypothetical protein
MGQRSNDAAAMGVQTKLKKCDRHGAMIRRCIGDAEGSVLKARRKPKNKVNILHLDLNSRRKPQL